MKQISRILALLLLIGATTFSACKEPEPESATITITPAELTFDWEAGWQSVTVSSTHDWQLEIEEGAEWITTSQNSHIAGKEVTFRVAVSSDNTSSEERVGRIAFHAEGTTEYLKVTQRGNSNSTPTPTIPKENCYSLNGEEHLLPSTAFMMVGENPAIVASPRMGLNSGEQILESSSYFYAAVSPVLNGVEFDLMTESSPYTLISTLSGALLECVAPGLTEEITSGKATFAIVDKRATFVAALTLASGSTLAINISTEAEENITINENTISRGAEKKPLRTAFYMNEEGMTYLYFTPAGIDYAEELEIATWYMYLMVGDQLINNQRISLTDDIIEGSNFILGLMDNLNADNSWTITGDELGGATGTILLKHNSEGNYTTLLEVVYGGVEYKIAFEGDCISCYDAPVVESNYLLYDGAKHNLTSATIDAKGEPWSLSLRVDNGKSVVITAPESFFDGNAHGFSQSPHLTVTYDGQTFSKANGNSGTLTLNLDQDMLTLDVAFTNYAGCEVAYSGAVTIYE